MRLWLQGDRVCRIHRYYVCTHVQQRDSPQRRKSPFIIIYIPRYAYILSLRLAACKHTFNMLSKNAIMRFVPGPFLDDGVFKYYTCKRQTSYNRRLLHVIDINIQRYLYVLLFLVIFADTVQYKTILNGKTELGVSVLSSSELVWTFDQQHFFSSGTYSPVALRQARRVRSNYFLSKYIVIYFYSYLTTLFVLKRSPFKREYK